MRCREPGHRAAVAIHPYHGPGRWAWVVGCRRSWLSL